MATRQLGLWGGTDENQIDLIDIGGLVILSFVAPVIFGVFTDFGINVFGEYTLLTPMWTVAGFEIAIGEILVVLAVGWIVVTNFINQDTDMKGAELGAAITAIALPLLFLAVPAVESLVMWHDVTQLAAAVYVAAAATYVSYVS